MRMNAARAADKMHTTDETMRGVPSVAEEFDQNAARLHLLVHSTPTQKSSPWNQKDIVTTWKAKYRNPIAVTGSATEGMEVTASKKGKKSRKARGSGQCSGICGGSSGKKQNVAETIRWRATTTLRRQVSIFGPISDSILNLEEK
jgi:hypothetical protein